MSSRFTKKSVVNASGRFVKTPKSDRSEVGVQDPQTADEHRHLRRAQRQALGAFHEQLLGGTAVTISQVVAETVEGRLEHGEGLYVGVLLQGVRATGREGNLHVVARRFAAFFHGGTAAEHDEVGQ